MQYRRQHPVKILGYTTKNFWLLSIPLIRGLFYLRFDVQAWLKGAWFDILVVTFILLFAVLRWLTVYYCFSDDTFYLKKGIFTMAHTSLSYSALTSVELEHSFLLKPFRASVLRIDTNCGGKRTSDIALTLKNKDVDALTEYFKNLSPTEIIKKCYYPSRKNLVFFSFVFSNTLSGVILLITLFMQGSKIVGKAFESKVFDTINSISQFFIKGLPPAALAISFVIALGWFISFISNLLRHWNFNCNRRGENILINNGYFTQRTNYLLENKINFVDLRQSLLTIIFRISSVHIHCTGYGKGKNAIAVLVPITFKREVLNTLRMLLPKFKTADTKIRPHKVQIGRFIFPPICIICVLSLLMLTFLLIFPTWTSMTLFVYYILLIPSVWLFIVKFIAAFRTGIGYTEGFLTAKYCRFYEYHCALIPVDKIAMVEIRQTYNQICTDNCNLVIYTHAEKTKKHKIKYMPYNDTLEFLKSNNINIL